MQRLSIARPSIWFPILTLVLTALHLYVWTLPRTPTPIPEPNTPEALWWGLWPVTYLPGWVVGLGVGLVLVTLVVGLWRHGWIGWLGEWDGRVIGLLVIGGLVVGFYLLPVVHTRWGDAYILSKALALDDPALRLTHSWQAPLDVRLHSQLWITFHERFGWEDAMPIYHLLSPIAGLLYLLAAVGISRQLTPIPRWMPCALLTSIGVMQLFFGYIENYSFAAAGILLYLWLGLRVLKRQSPLWLAALALAVTNALHPSTLVYGLSLLYLGWHLSQQNAVDRGQKAEGSGDGSRITRVPPGRASRITHHAFHILIPMFLIGGGTILMMELDGHGIGALLTTDRPGGGDARWLVPLWETSTRWEQYTLFSWPHLRDMINQQLLVAPIVLPGIGLLLVDRFAGALRHWLIGWFAPPQSPLNQSTNQLPTLFLTLATLPHLLLTWLWNPDYGGQRDWDLFSLAAIPLTVLFAQLLARRWAQMGQGRTAPTDGSPEIDATQADDGSSTTEWADTSVERRTERSALRRELAGLIPLLVLQYLHTAAWIYQNTLPWEWP